ncbi:MAG TPA: hypothetical protein VIO32_01190 [Candidatus Baltobacteraceae bacterium]
MAAARPALADTFAVTVPVLAEPPSMKGVVDSSWAKAQQLPVNFDFTYQRSGEPATVYVAQDAHALDLAFVVTQHATITDNAETNGPGVLNDDNVTVDLWPQGSSGFHYAFSANARGARYQTSSENSAFAPDWTAVARRTPDGYIVTMRIPFGIMRAGGSKSWKAQFERVVQATNSDIVWEHVQGQRNGAEVAYAGTLDGVEAGSGARSGRPQPRLQFYALGEATNAANGGNTSRIGADLALPVTATSSFLASFHPDYSNVEIDQQTIAPSAFPRFYSEVRPFFTQLSNHYNDTMSCTNCPTMLYTPAIPTFRQGYAYEGTAGHMSFAAFDAVGFGRTDDAQAVSYTIQDSDKIESLALQRVGVNLPGFNDVTTSLFSGYEWQHTHMFVYYNAALDSGTNVTDPSQARYVEYGAGHVDKNGVYGFSFQRIGPQFAPADGFVQLPDVNGVSLFVNHTIHFDPKNWLQDISYSNFFVAQNDHRGSPSFHAYSGQVNFDLRSQLTLHVFAGYQKNETFDGQYLPFNQNGFYLGYKTQTTTPSSLLYAGGPYYHGSLSSWSYLTTRPLTRQLKLSLEADENTYAPGGTYAALEPGTRQWLERASLDWQFNRYASFDLGARRIVGRNLPNAFETPTFDEINAGNASAAFHFLAAHNEWYVVYGSPNNLSTLPAFYVKWIRYIGAEKGT